MRIARPSTMAVLPTPGSPISTGLFLVRRASTWMVRRISSSRPITGSSLPSRANCGDVAGVFLQGIEVRLGVGRVDLAALADVVHRLLQRLRRSPGGLQRAGGGRVGRGQRHQQPVLRDVLVAGLGRGLLRGVQHAHQFRGDLRLSRARSLHLRLPRELGLHARRPPAFGSPPAVRISPAAAPSSSSSSALSRCSGVIRWWKSRIAMVCAACRNPRARSVNFSISICRVPVA